MNEEDNCQHEYDIPDYCDGPAICTKCGHEQGPFGKVIRLKKKRDPKACDHEFNVRANHPLVCSKCGYRP